MKEDFRGLILQAQGVQNLGERMVATVAEAVIRDNDFTLAVKLDTPVPLTIPLPAPADLPVEAGSVRLRIRDAAGNAGTYPITISATGTTINGAATYVISTDGGNLDFEWTGDASMGWVSYAQPPGTGSVADVLGSTNIDVTGGAVKTISLKGPISAALLADGSVSNAEFQTLDGINTGTTIQAQLDTKLATNGNAGSLTNIPAAQLAGDIARARMSVGLAAGGDPVAGTVLTAATRIETPTIGTNSSNQHALPSGTGALLTSPLTGAQQVWLSGDYGDGSSGALTVNAGTQTASGASYYTDLHVTSTGIFITGNYPIYVSGTLTVDSGGVIHCDGGDASGFTGGTSTTTHFYPGFTQSPGNGQAVNGSSTSGGSNTFSGAGGAGGAGSGGTGGTSAATTAPAATTLARTAWMLENGKLLSGTPATTLSGTNGGTGGAGGGGDGVNRGGGGGACGGYVMIKARHAVIAGTIRSNGGRGANGTATNCGGGGGGGGGTVVFICPDATITGTIAATGGAKGLSGGGAGVDGVNGSNGTVFTIGAS